MREHATGPGARNASRAATAKWLKEKRQALGLIPPDDDNDDAITPTGPEHRTANESEISRRLKSLVAGKRSAPQHRPVSGSGVSSETGRTAPRKASSVRASDVRAKLAAIDSQLSVLHVSVGDPVKRAARRAELRAERAACEMLLRQAIR